MARAAYIPTTFDHIGHVALNMRQADRDEVMASHLQTPVESLLLASKISDMMMTMVAEDGEPIAILGVAPRCRLVGLGAPWLLGTDRILQHARQFYQDPEFVIEQMMSYYPNLENYVHCKNTVSVRWLRAIGFKFDEPVVFPLSGERFMRFYMNKEN